MSEERVRFIKDIPRETEVPEGTMCALNPDLLEETSDPWPGESNAGYKSFKPSLRDRMWVRFYRMKDWILSFPFLKQRQVALEDIGMKIYFNEFSAMGVLVEVPESMNHIRITMIGEACGIGCYRCGIAKQFPHKPWLYQESVTNAVWLFSREHKGCKGNSSPIGFIPYPKKARS